MIVVSGLGMNIFSIYRLSESIWGIFILQMLHFMENYTQNQIIILICEILAPQKFLG